MPETQQLNQLRQQIEDQFNAEEVRDLCFQLGLDYDDLGGRGRAANIRELVAWAERRNRFSDLMALVKAARPHNSDIMALLPPHHILYHKNELFSGRAQMLAQLHTQLGDGGAVAVTATGLGGVGKTQLALAYCYRHLDEYDLIQWLRADDTTTLATEMAALAYRLGLAQRSVTDQNVLRQLALDWLQTTPRRWLLVYDNADTIQAGELRPFLPKMGNGASLITSRNPNWGGLAQTLRLAVFTQEEALDFLLGGARTDEAEKATAQLAETLGYLPLALEHARAYVEVTGLSWAEYGQTFAAERQALWAQAPAPDDYGQRTITTTWEIAFRQVRATPGAAALLNLCCFLAPDDIPLSLLTDAAGKETKPPLPDEFVQMANSKLKLNNAIVALRRYSLMSRSDSTVSIHGLVQTVARDQMPSETALTWGTAAVNLVEDVFPADPNMLYVWKEGSQLLPHITSVIEQAVFYAAVPVTTAYLCNRVGFYLDFLGNYGAARPYYEQAKAIAERDLGSNHTETAVYLNNMGGLLKAVGDYAGARPYMERALAIDEKALGVDHPSVARDLNNLGSLLQDEGDYAGARSYMERALTIDEKTLGPNHPSVARDLNNLGQLLQDLGDYAEVRPYLERALAIWEKTLDSDHPQVAIGNNNLGLLLQDLGDYAGALPYMERALTIDEKALGSDHPDVAINLNNLGLLLQELGDYAEARPYMERALTIDEKALGPDHPSVARDLNNLGLLLQAEGDYAEARPCMERALTIDDKALGPDHPNVAIDLNNLGTLLQDLGDYTGARPYLERAVAILEATIPDHPNTARTRRNLAALLAETE